MLNSCNFIGNLGQDPEIRRDQQGRAIANFSIACSERWRDKNSGEQKERTEWIRCVSFSEGLNKIIEQYLKKGSKVYVSGKMQTRKWQDQSGADRYSTEVVLQGFEAKLVMLDGKSDETRSQGNSGGGNAYQEQSQGNRPQNDIDDEIPFSCEWR